MQVRSNTVWSTQMSTKLSSHSAAQKNPTQVGRCKQLHILHAMEIRSMILSITKRTLDNND